MTFFQSLQQIGQAHCNKRKKEGDDRHEVSFLYVDRMGSQDRGNKEESDTEGADSEVFVERYGVDKKEYQNDPDNRCDCVKMN